VPKNQISLTKVDRVLRKTLAKHRSKIAVDAIDGSQGQLGDSVIFATDRLRHAALHQLPTTAAGIQQMVLSATKLAIALNDTVRAVKMEQVYCELESRMRGMEGKKEFLESTLDKELKAIDEQRAELDKKSHEP